MEKDYIVKKKGESTMMQYKKFDFREKYGILVSSITEIIVIGASHSLGKIPQLDRLGDFFDYLPRVISNESRTLHTESITEIFIKMKSDRWGYKSPPLPTVNGEPTDCMKKIG